LACFLIGRQDPGGDLVEQRLEQVVVGAVHHRDLDVGPLQRLRDVQPAEPAPDHDHTVSHLNPPPRYGVMMPVRPPG
jgi:hypothetical protein